MRIPTPIAGCCFGMCLSLPAASAEVVEAVKEPTGKAVQLRSTTARPVAVAWLCLPPGRYVSGPLWLKNNKVFGINVQDWATVSDVRFMNVTFETHRRHWNWWGSVHLDLERI